MLRYALCIALAFFAVPMAYAQNDVSIAVDPDTVAAIKDTIAWQAVRTPMGMPYPQQGRQRTTQSFLYGSLSASYATSQNWAGQDLKNYAFATNLLYRHSVFGNSRSHTHQLAADLGYLKFVDSTWVKHVDRILVNLLWNSSGRKISR